MDSEKTHRDSRIFLYAYARANLFSLFIQCPIHWLYYVEESFFCKKKCSSSGQKDNRETVPVLKKIYYLVTSNTHVNVQNLF